MDAAETALTTLPLSIRILITLGPIFVKVVNIMVRMGFSELSGVSVPIVASVRVVPMGAVRALACSSEVKGRTSLMMHPTCSGVSSKVLARSGSAS